MSKPIVQPFAALRPIPEYAQIVAAPPYDVMSTAEARELAKDNPWSFLHISRPEIDLPQGINPFSCEVYSKGAENMARMLSEGILCRDDAPGYYIYRVQTDDHVQTGIVGVGSVEAYEDNLIRRHELTRPDKETDRVKQILAVNAQTGPVFATHKNDNDLSTLMEELTLGEPAYSIIGDGGSIHTLWVVMARQVINRIAERFEKLGAIYIADGHHRSAAASRVAAELKRTNPAHNGSEPYNSILVVSFPETEVQILDYNRVVKDINGLSASMLLDRIEEYFEVFSSDLPAQPESAGSFGMYLAGGWYILRFKGDLVSNNTIKDDLDVSILSDKILSPVLGIGDHRTDPRIGFVGGIRGMSELERQVDSGDWEVAFALFPITVSQIMTLADAQKTTPPKTTWFEPKLADGLVSLALD